LADFYVFALLKGVKQLDEKRKKNGAIGAAARSEASPTPRKREGKRKFYQLFILIIIIKTFRHAFYLHAAKGSYNVYAGVVN